MPADSPSDHLAELRRRWQAEPGSRLFLQLAEEYRRADRHAEAVEVLEAGLESHPNHVSAHVALGRARLEMGQPDGAVSSLERALELDATNLVANKLLVEGYLARGERERARHRLELYGLLNDGDPDIADLRRRIARRSGSAEDASASPVSADRGDGAEENDATLDGVLAEDLAWGGKADGESLQATTSGEPGSPAVESEADVDSGGWKDAVEEEPMTTRSAHDEPESTREGTTAADAPPRSSGGEPPEPFGDLAAGGAEHRYLQGLAGEGLFPLADDRSAPNGASGQATAAGPPSPAHRPSVAGTEEREGPTVTLGQLYLEQGHFSQARRVFAALLEDDPEHPAARHGLERAERELDRGGPERLTAADLLHEAEPGQPARRAMLGAYLARILRRREGRPRDVPR